MKLPSVTFLIDKSLKTAIRFPTVLLCALIGTITMMYMIEQDLDSAREASFIKIIITCTLGLPLFLSLTVWAETHKNKPITKIILSVIGILLLVLYYFTLPEYIYPTAVYRHFLFVVVLHLLVSFAPFVAERETNGFWQYNKVLFIRILSALLYSGVLYAGLTVALLAVNNLFDVDIDGKRYAQLWVFLAGIFNTWFLWQEFLKILKV